MKELEKWVKVRLVHFKASSFVVKDGHHLFIKKEFPGLSKEVKTIHTDFYHWKLTVCSISKEALTLDLFKLNNDIWSAFRASRLQNLIHYRLNFGEGTGIRKFNIEGWTEPSDIYMNLGTRLSHSKEFNLELTAHVIVVFDTSCIRVSIGLFSFAHMPRCIVLALDF